MSDNPKSKIDFLHSWPNLPILALLGSGICLLLLVGYVIWNDLTFWNKDLGTIFFENRAGQPIAITLIYYVIVSITLSGTGIMLFLRKNHSKIVPLKENTKSKTKSNKKQTKNETMKINTKITKTKKKENNIPNEEVFFSGCKNHFGYLASRPRGSEIPPECIICQRLGDCMVATIYTQK